MFAAARGAGPAIAVCARFHQDSGSEDGAMSRIHTVAVPLLLGLTVWVSSSCSQREVEAEGTYFDKKIAPILNGSCATSPTGSLCHVTADQRGNALGNLDVTSYEMLAKRQDLLENFGPYGMPALLAKAVSPQTLKLTAFRRHRGRHRDGYSPRRRQRLRWQLRVLPHGPELVGARRAEEQLAIEAADHRSRSLRGSASAKIRCSTRRRIQRAPPTRPSSTK